MYTHARQFPHVAGLRDDKIRGVARRAMQRHPHYRRTIRARNIVVLLAMALGTGLLNAIAGMQVGLALMIVGAAATVFVLVWNLVWVNTVLFRITQEEMEMESVRQRSD